MSTMIMFVNLQTTTKLFYEAFAISGACSDILSKMKQVIFETNNLTPIHKKIFIQTMLKAKNNKWFLFQMLLVVTLETKGNETGKYFNCVHDYTTQLS